MRVLVTGAGGFVGRHVVRDLAGAGHAPSAFDLHEVAGLPLEKTLTGDLRDPAHVAQAVEALQPDACIHLGGMAYVPAGWTQPNQMVAVNLLGTVNVLEAFRKASPSARVLVITSSEVYGRMPSARPLAEDFPMQPAGLYAVFKMAADLTALLYARRYGMPVMTARPENHIGPGQSTHFVVPAFAAQIASIKQGRAEPLVRVGNLDNERDFTDVRDVARAYRLLIERGRAGEAYNIASGRAVRIRTILDTLCRLAGVKPRVEIDPERHRPTDRLPLLDVSKLHTDTGWTPRIALEDSLRDILADAEARPGPAPKP